MPSRMLLPFQMSTSIKSEHLHLTNGATLLTLEQYKVTLVSFKSAVAQVARK